MQAYTAQQARGAKKGPGFFRPGDALGDVIARFEQWSLVERWAQILKQPRHKPGARARVILKAEACIQDTDIHHRPLSLWFNNFCYYRVRALLSS